MEPSNISAQEAASRTVQLTMVAQSSKSLAMASIYALMFLVGSYGNVIVISCIQFIRHTLSSEKKSRWSNFNHSRSMKKDRHTSTTFFYVTALCCADLAAMLSIPLTIADLLLGSWIFGETMCKVHFLLDSVSKTLSTFLLTLISFDRYIAICHARNNRLQFLRSPKSVMSLLVLSLICALGLLAPLPFNARVSRKLERNIDMGFQNLIGNLKVDYCNDGMGTKATMIFAIYIFVLGFCIPAGLMSFFYAQILLKVRRHKKKTRQSRIPLGHIVRYTLAVTCFYFICRTPYWVSLLYQIYITQTSSEYPEIMKSHAFVLFMLIIHLFPYLSSALNWLFFVVLNSQIRRCYHEAVSSEILDLNSDSPNSPWYSATFQPDRSAQPLENNVVNDMATSSVGPLTGRKIASCNTLHLNRRNGKTKYQAVFSEKKVVVAEIASNTMTSRINGNDVLV